MRPRPEIGVGPDLSLRLIAAADAPELFALLKRDNPRLREWLPGVIDKYRTLEAYRGYVEGALRKFEDEGTPDFVVIANGEKAGIFEYAPRGDEPSEGEIGFLLGDAFAGRGIGRRALAAVVEYGFAVLEYRSLLVATAEGNSRARRLVESLGFVSEGIQRDAELLRNELVHHVHYRLRR